MRNLRENYLKVINNNSINIKILLVNHLLPLGMKDGSGYPGLAQAVLGQGVMAHGTTQCLARVGSDGKAWPGPAQ